MMLFSINNVELYEGDKYIGKYGCSSREMKFSPFSSYTSIIETFHLIDSTGEVIYEDQRNYVIGRDPGSTSPRDFFSILRRYKTQLGIHDIDEIRINEIKEL